VIGSILLWARTHPEFYEARYPTYDAFITEYVCGIMGLGRTTLYAARRVAERLPGLSADELAELGPTRAGVLAEMTHSNNSDFPEMLAKARNSTATALQRWGVEKNLIGEGDLEQAVIMIRSNKAIDRRWREFIERSDVQDYCASEKGYLILEKLLMEAEGVWLGQPHDVCPACNGSGRVIR
jgi:hypothetical protein